MPAASPLIQPTPGICAPVHRHYYFIPRVLCSLAPACVSARHRHTSCRRAHRCPTSLRSIDLMKRTWTCHSPSSYASALTGAGVCASAHHRHTSCRRANIISAPPRCRCARTSTPVSLLPRVLCRRACACRNTTDTPCAGVCISVYCHHCPESCTRHTVTNAPGHCVGT